MNHNFKQNLILEKLLHKRLLAQLMSVILLALFCISAAYWATQLFKPKTENVPLPVATPAFDINQAAHIFGDKNVSTASGMYQLTGLVHAINGVDSIAIISVDGQPARSFRIGADVMPNVTVKEVYANYVLLSERGVLKRLALPEHLSRNNEALSTSTAEKSMIPAGVPPAPPDESEVHTGVEK